MSDVPVAPNTDNDPREMPDDYPFDSDDDEDEDGWANGENCGRWINGRLGQSCSLAGTEDCDWECPYSR